MFILQSDAVKYCDSNAFSLNNESFHCFRKLLYVFMFKQATVSILQPCCADWCFYVHV